MACPDAEVIQSLFDGRLAGAARDEILGHAGECAACRAVIAELARHAAPALADTAPSGPTVDREADPLARGAALGRFVVIRELGAGGMGVVVSAYDPVLERRVAVKLLRADRFDPRASPEWRARLLREAQAVAKLSHPNIVTVHEVGSEGDQVFVVMEQVDGGTLRTWLAAQPRGWRAVRDMFVLAGRGLAAAHGAGLVHRDFKPENVLVGGDGRVRVTDFGLVGVSASPAPTSDARAPSLTRTGAVMGTPKYMAPEQHQGNPVDARADQFAFCVALYEAVCGGPPFAGDTLETLAAEVCAGRVRAPAGDAPAWLRRAILRGLRVDPAERHPTMDALLAELGRDQTIARRRAVLAAAVALGAAAGGLWLARPARCSGAAARLAGVWDDAVKERMRERFLATGKPYAADSFARVAAKLDEHVGAWAAMHRDACLTTRRGEQSEAALDLRMGCLGRQLAETRALTFVLASADAAVVERSVEAAGSLTDVEGCADVERLGAVVPAPADAKTRAEVDNTRTVLATAKAWAKTGRYREARALAAPAVVAAQALAYKPLEAEALYLAGGLAILNGDPPAAQEQLFHAALAADAARADALKADAQIGVVQARFAASKYDEALRAGEVAGAALARLGADPVRSARLQAYVGAVLEDLGRYAEARVRLLAALALDESALGPGDPAVASDERRLASVAFHEGRYAEAAARQQRAADIAERAYGPAHPELATHLERLARILLEQGQTDVALAMLHRVLVIREAALGPDHPHIAITLAYIGDVHQARGDYRQALASYRRALPIMERKQPADADTGKVLNRAGQAAFKLGLYDEALAAYERSRELQERAFGPEHPDIGATLLLIGDVLLTHGKTEEALQRYRSALAMLVKTGGAEHPNVVWGESRIGMALSRLGRHDEAIQHLRRAVAAAEKLYGNSHASVAEMIHNLGDALLRQQKYAEALREEQRALAMFERTMGEANVMLAYPLTNIGAADIELRQPDRAIAPLERALGLREKNPTEAVDLGDTRFYLAQALWESGKDRPGARTLAASARKDYERGGEWARPGVARVDAWLAKRR